MGGIDIDTTEDRYGGFEINFNTNPPSLNHHPKYYGQDFQNASLCSENGELILYSNGCLVLNALDEQIKAMKDKKLLFLIFKIFFLMAFYACGNEEYEYSYNLDGARYPKGIVAIDLTTTNDCTLPWCDSNRTARLEIHNVDGFLRLDSILQVTFTFDSYIEFHICNKGEIEFDFTTEEHQKVRFCGIARDACGYLHNGFPLEEEYFIELTKIQSL